ncbi:unnamed protein product [Lampetra planeri]
MRQGKASVLHKECGTGSQAAHTGQHTFLHATAARGREAALDSGATVLNHSMSLVQRMETLLAAGNGSDVTLRVHTINTDEVKVIQAHSLVLTLQSDVFEELLLSRNNSAVVLMETPDCAAVFDKFVRCLQYLSWNLSSVLQRKKKNPGLKLAKEVFAQPPPAVRSVSNNLNYICTKPPRDLDSKACVTIGDQNFVVKADDLEQIAELGRGAYGVVDKMRHVPSGVIMAVKRIRATVNTLEQKRLLMDLDISMRTVDCFYTVTFYGALFREVEVSLRKKPNERPAYTELMKHPFFTLHDSKDTDVASFVKVILDD